jgi:plastocyanin
MTKHLKYKAVAVLCGALLLAMTGVVCARRAHAAPPAGESSISGTVKLNGTPPRQKPIDMSKEPSCAAIHASKPVITENVIADPSGGLANVVVYISQGWSGPAVVTPQPAQIDQKGCQYLPHVVALDAGEHMKVVNSDQTSHNIHPQPTKNSEWNKSQPPGSPPFDVTWNNEEVAIPVKCNIHPWMHGYIVVVKGPYGVSDTNGSFTIPNVPPGNYTLTAWQETYGTQTQQITVSAGKAATASFAYTAK